MTLGMFLLDFFLTFGLFGLGVSLIVGSVKLGHYYDEVNRLERMDTVRLHVELTRCVGAIMVCAGKGDAKSCRHARRHLRRTNRVLMKKEAARRRAEEIVRVAEIVERPPRRERRVHCAYIPDRPALTGEV